MSTNEQSINWYNENARNYTEHVRNPDESVYHSLYEKPAMYSLLPDVTDMDVLSLGCGSGEDSQYLKLSGAKRSVGVDISEAMITIASTSYSDCEFEVMDMESLNLDNDTFDFAYSSLAIHYIENWTTAASEVYRTLKPGSHFLLSFNHPLQTGITEVENTPQRKIEKLELVKDKTANRYNITGDCLQRKPLSDALGKGTVTTWFKPISEIAAELTRPGFMIEEIVEPKPQDKMREISLKDYEILCKVPSFMIMKLYKPKGE